MLAFVGAFLMCCVCQGSRGTDRIPANFSEYNVLSAAKGAKLMIDGRGILMDFQTKRPVGTKPTPLPNSPPTPSTPSTPNTPPPSHTPPPRNTPPSPNTLPPPNTTPTLPKPQTSRPPVCRDYDHRCGNWARNGECYRNPRYMLRYCKKSCKRCTTVSCKDFHWRCQAWSKRGECHRNPGYMLVSCKRSCRKC